MCLFSHMLKRRAVTCFSLRCLSVSMTALAHVVLQVKVEEAAALPGVRRELSAAQQRITELEHDKADLLVQSAAFRTKP